MMKLTKRALLAKPLALFLLMGFLSVYVVPQVKAESGDIDVGKITQLAEQGDAETQLNLGVMYYNGNGVSQDYKQAFKWSAKAAEQGLATAQYNLGVMYYHGNGVSQDYKQAFKWFTKAAEQGYDSAQYNLGVMYYGGHEVPRDIEQAVKWYTKAAEQGHAEARYKLGEIYYRGYGVFLDIEQAVKWYTKAAELGHTEATYKLGEMYKKGEYVPRNYKQAVKWYTKAAKQGVAKAQFNLGVMYANGEGVPQNNKMAYIWSSLAATNGDESARKNRNILADKLPPKQLAEAQELAIKIQYKIDHPTESKKQQPSVSKTEKKVSSSGTGFIITKKGYVMTCYHVIADSNTIKIKVGNDIYSAKVVRKDPNNDLALLKIHGTFPALAFSSKRSAKMGQEVFTIGFPNPVLQGISAKFTNGTVNSLTGFRDDVRLYQISVPVQPGNSGGPLLDDRGNIIGVIVAMIDAKTAFNITGSLPQNVNYAVKSTYAQAIIDTMPEVAAKLLSPSRNSSFDAAVDRVKKSVVMVLTYE